jgi:glycosyltransferase involved in cell wall biosynthesis
MNLLMLAKRFGSGKDAILDDFGRQVRLAENLVRLGNKVDLVAADYVKHKKLKKNLNGVDVDVVPLSFFSFLSYVLRLRKKISYGKYDAVIASSDPVFGVAAYLAAGKTAVVYDVQDDYGSYRSSRIPFLRLLEKKVIRKSILVTAVSKTLEKDVKKYNNTTIVIENGIDSRLIKPIPQLKSRKKYGLPEKGIIIAYAGSEDPYKVSIDFIIKGFNLFRQKNPNAYLLLIGDGNISFVNRHRDKGVMAFDSVSYKSLMELLSSADVFLLPYKDTMFTKMSMPYKLSEYMAFSKPIVCSDFGDMGAFLKNTSQLIFKPENINDFAKKIQLAVKIRKVSYSKQLQSLKWREIAFKLHKKLSFLLK